MGIVLTLSISHLKCYSTLTECTTSSALSFQIIPVWKHAFEVCLKAKINQVSNSFGH